MPPSSSPSESARPAVFLDRDGTINAEVDYLADPDDLHLIPGAAAAIARLNAAGYLCVVITNQSGIARGMLDEPQLARIHTRLDELLAAQDAHIDHYEYCPHHPELGEPPYRQSCECRKPGAGLFKQAMQHLAIDLEHSWVVGDSARDLQAGATVQIPGLLVTTGKPVTAELRERYTVVADLSAAVDRILG